MRRGDISITHHITSEIEAETEYWKEVHKRGEVDIVFCPYPFIEALWRNVRNNRDMLQGMDEMEYMLSLPFRCVVSVDRISKLASINKQII